MEKEKAIKKCIICKKDNSKYKCPNCKNNYCSINCFNEHKKICIRNEEKNNKIEDNLNSNKPLNLDEDEDIILEKKDLEKLKENKKIMNMLKNNTLRKIIREIDSAKYKKRTLERYIDKDPDFKEFTTEILETLGFIKNNEFIYK